MTECKHCGLVVESGNPGASYCSRTCSGLARRSRITCKCETCGTDFETTPGNARRFCSIQCRDLRQSKLLRCVQCGVDFTKTRKQSKFCSDECRTAGRSRQVVRDCPRCHQSFSLPASNPSKCCSVKCSRQLRGLPELLYAGAHVDASRYDMCSCGSLKSLPAKRCGACWKASRRVEITDETRRKRHLWQKYRIRVDEWESMFARQRGACAICQAALVRSRDTARETGNEAVTDHCHATGKVRGILCQPCNRGLGAFRDNPAAMENAAGYLRASM